MDPEHIIQQQVEAYNERDLKGFVKLFAADIKVYNYSEAEPSIDGIEAFRSSYEAVFRDSPALAAQVINRMVIGNKVIDHEHITGRAGVEFLEIVVIYEIKDDLIQKVSYIRTNS